MDNVKQLIPFEYGDFYDVPRIVRFHFEGSWYLLRSRFDEEIDDYQAYYTLYRLPFKSESDMADQPDYWWDTDNAIHLGTIPLSNIEFDPTSRRSFCSSVVVDSIKSHNHT